MNPLNQRTEKIIGCAIAVHRELDPGLLESRYEAALALVPVIYKGLCLCGFFL
jgi:hypothetical protein